MILIERHTKETDWMKLSRGCRTIKPGPTSAHTKLDLKVEYADFSKQRLFHNQCCLLTPVRAPRWALSWLLTPGLLGDWSDLQAPCYPAQHCVFLSVKDRSHVKCRFCLYLLFLLNQMQILLNETHQTSWLVCTSHLKDTKTPVEVIQTKHKYLKAYIILWHHSEIYSRSRIEN